MSNWTINGTSLETLGITITRGEFASGGVSQVMLSAARDFDAAELFAPGTDLVLAKDGVRFFVGKVRQIPKSGSAANEAQEYALEDAWADLERLTYQEPWAIRQPDYTGVIYSPSVVLGMNSAGVRINVGQQIIEVINFAIGQGVALQLGTIPAGMMLWPSEVTGMSCAQVIRDCLKYYPDRMPWINHLTTPPTFNVTPRADAAALTVAVTDCEEISVTETVDRVPEGVRIVYLTAGLIDGEVYRTVAIDQYPAVDTETLVQPAGPGILITTVELAGMQMQVQKQQVQVRDLPETQATAKEYLKLKFPAVKDIGDGTWTISAWSTAVIPDDYTGDPIDAKLERKYGANRTDLPRELVRGNIAEWMQKKVGRVLVEFKVKAADSATDEEREKIESLPPNFTVVATNAVTKIYKGVSSFEAAESVPVGIAEAYFKTIISGCNYAGSVTAAADELPLITGAGMVMNLTGSAVSEWATMAAPIHTISWDVESGTLTRNFGPNPDLAVEDFLEFLKLLNKRPYSSFTMDERTGDQLGDDGGISAAGDSVGGFDQPETIYGAGAMQLPVPFTVTVELDGSDWKAGVKLGYVLFNNPKTSAAPVSKYWIPAGLDAIPAPTYTVADGQAIFCRVATDKNGAPTSVKMEVAAKDTPTIHYQPPPDEPVAVSVNGDYYYKIAEFELVGEKMVVKQFQRGGPIVHIAQLWEGKNVGEGAYKVFKQIEPETGRYKFRTIHQLSGDGHPLLKPMEDPDDPPDQIEVRLLKEKEGDPQIHLESEAGDDAIIIRGNDYENSIDLPGGASVLVMDGLVTEMTSSIPGGTGSLGFLDCDGAELFTLEWDRGVITTSGYGVISCGCDGDGSSTSPPPEEPPPEEPP